jgi:hypothetical protein
LRATWIIPLLVIWTFFIGIWAWHDRHYSWGDAVYRAVSLFDIGNDLYNQGGHLDWRFAVGRWTGLAAVFSTAGVALTAVLHERVSRWRAALSRGHTMVVGDHLVAAALIARARQFGHGVLHVSDHVNEATSAAGFVTLPRHVMQDPRGFARRSNLILVAESDTGASAETALTLTRGMNLEGSAKVRVHLDDPVAAEGFHHLPGGYDIVTFSLAQAAAREVLLRQPPFVLARKRQAEAIHVLIVGFGRLAESLLADILVNSVSAGLGEPWITVVDESAAAAQRSFISRYPEAGEIGRIRFVDTLDNDTFENLQGQLRGRAPPICAAYVCIHNSAEAFSAAIALRDRAFRDGLFEAPIFVYLPSGGGLPRQLSGAARHEEIPLLGFGDVDDVVLVSQALDRDADEWPKKVNIAYAEAYGRIYGGTVSPAPWRTLPEPMRQSNRRVITHIPAKLASLGFDLTPLIEAPLGQRLELPALHPDHPMFRNDADRRIAAELEHRRWAADRQLSGWRLGKRDNRRRFHPDLIPFEDLSDAVQAFDFAVNDWLDAVLPRRPDGLKRLGEAVD